MRCRTPVFHVSLCVLLAFSGPHVHLFSFLCPVCILFVFSCSFLCPLSFLRPPVHTACFLVHPFCLPVYFFKLSIDFFYRLVLFSSSSVCPAHSVTSSISSNKLTNIESSNIFHLTLSFSSTFQQHHSGPIITAFTQKIHFLYFVRFYGLQ